MSEIKIITVAAVAFIVFMVWRNRHKVWVKKDGDYISRK